MALTPFKILEKLIEKHPQLKRCEPEISKAFELMVETYNKNGTLFLCGNGGSAADSAHIEGELLKGFCLGRQLSDLQKLQFSKLNDDRANQIASKLQNGLRTLALTNSTALATAIANDGDPTMIFAQPLYVWAKPNDLFMGISTSGNSKNVINAFIVAKSKDIKSIALTGKTGGAIKELADVSIVSPGDTVWEIQENHLPIYHALCMMLEVYFFRN